MLAVICLLTPALLHRLANGRHAAPACGGAFRLQVLGMAFVAVALIRRNSGRWPGSCYGTGLAWCLTLPVVVLVLAAGSLSRSPCGGDGRCATEPRSGTGRGCRTPQLCKHNASMKNVLVRDVPDDVPRQLQRRADAAGQSLQQYLSAELTRLATTPTMADVLDRIARRRGGRVGLSTAVTDLDQARTDGDRPRRVRAGQHRRR